MFSHRKNRKEREKLVDLTKALEHVGPPEGEPGVPVPYAEVDHVIDLPSEEEIARENADRRRDSLAPGISRVAR